MRAGAVLVLAIPSLLGCPPTCVAALDLDCAPLYEPTFDNVHTNTLAPSCAVSGGACHASATSEGGLDLSQPDAAHAALVGGPVIEGDAACSELVVRLESPRSSEQMPPGSPLSEAERCAIRLWVDGGALR